MSRSRPWVDQSRYRRWLRDFFQEERDDLSIFGNRINQTFEIFTFALVVKWYKENGWDLKFIHSPTNDGKLKLKYSTKGKPTNYTYVKVTKNDTSFEIRHNLRIQSAHSFGEIPTASFFPDVSVVTTDIISEEFTTDTPLNNMFLQTFTEAKHLNAYSELIASFLGMVHEIKPEFITSTVTITEGSGEFAQIGILEKVGVQSVITDVNNLNENHLFPTLFLSGFIQPSAQSVIQTIESRKLRINVMAISNRNVDEIEVDELRSN